ncbi:MAG: carboxypeptidase-like regulatory domain-containing protein [Gemmatimonadaceae bacterium]
MRPALCTLLRLTVAVASLASAPLAAQKRFVAPTQETVRSRTEEREGDPPAHLIFVENGSTVPITVFSVGLSGCENIKMQCHPQQVKLRVGPGQSRLALRVEPKNPTLGFGYQFHFGWNADSSGIAAEQALAASGSTAAQRRIETARRADSLDRATPGPRYNELTREDFTVLGPRAAALRAVPESLMLTPGERTTMDRVRLVVVDSQGVVLGRTRWLRWQRRLGGAVDFTPPDQLVARQPGRAVFHFELAEEAQGLLGRVLSVDVPFISAYPPDPHAPSFTGLVVDADRQTPLACAPVALEDSTQNVVDRDRTTRIGSFVLTAPRPGTYRVRVDMNGWSPTYGPNEVGHPDEQKQTKYAVRFTEPLLAGGFGADAGELEHAAPAAIVAPPIGAPKRQAAPARAPSAPTIRAVTLGGSTSRPILSIAGSAPAGTTWVQFLVDSTGRVDSTSTLLAPDADPATVASVNMVLPRVRFSPARQAGVPICELLQMQVNLNGGAR